jgi:hypothetical protein
MLRNEAAASSLRIAERFEKTLEVIHGVDF